MFFEIIFIFKKQKKKTKIQKEKRQVKKAQKPIIVTMFMVIKDHPTLKMNRAKLIQKQLRNKN